MQQLRDKIEKKTILKYKYGKNTKEDSFNVKNLLNRNISSNNHIVKNRANVKKAM